MTLYTDRRTLQVIDVERMLQRADYYAQLRNSDYSQPPLTQDQAIARHGGGLVRRQVDPLEAAPA